MKRFWPALLLIWIVGLSGCLEKTPAAGDRLKVQLGGETFHLELALTDAQITRGLMERASLGPQEGMLFVFTDLQVRSFWMKNCLIDLDILYLDGQGHIVNLQRMTAPDPKTPEHLLPRYSSRLEAQYAIELAAGSAARTGLKEGDRIDLPFKALQQLARKASSPLQ